MSHNLQFYIDGQWVDPVVANAGHFPHWEQPEEFADALVRFIDSK